MEKKDVVQKRSSRQIEWTVIVQRNEAVRVSVDLCMRGAIKKHFFFVK